MSTQNPQKINIGTEFLVNDGAGNTFWSSAPSTSETYIKNFIQPTAWLDASDTALITKDSGNLISLVIDKSGNGNNFTPSNSNFKPLYITSSQNGLGGIQFGATSSTNLVTPGFIGINEEHFTQIIVRKIGVLSTPTSIELDFSTNNYFTSTAYSWKTVQSLTTSTNGTLGLNGVMGNIGKDNTYNSKAIIETTRFGYGRRTFGIDNRILSRPETGQHGLTGAITLGTNTPNGNASKSDILEELFFSRYIGDNELSYIIRYLDKKWNVIQTEPSLTDARKYNTNSQVFFLGDSLTAGIGDATVENGYTYNYVNQVMEKIGGCFFHNIGNPGANIASIQANADKYVIPLYSSQYEKNVVVVWAGINDIVSTSDTASIIFTRLSNLCLNLKNKGFKVAVVTITPNTSLSAPVDFEARRTSLNNLIISGYTSFADGLINLTTDALISGATASDNTTYFFEKLHYRKLGYGRIAAIAYPVIKTLMNS